MNVLAIGDIHGRRNWETLRFEDYDKVIFAGDYVDSYHVDEAEITDVFTAILALKRNDPDRFVLLLGNHDVHYRYFPEYPCSGFRPAAQPVWSRLFRDNEDLFQAAWQYRHYLFTHAGVSERWARKHGIAPSSDLFNSMLSHRDGRDILFECGALRGGAPSALGGIVWADQRETYRDFYPGLHQVVGHTPQPFIRRVGDEDGSVTYIDVLERTTAFWEKVLA